VISHPDPIVEPLSRMHDREAFSCGVPALDRYIQRQARQDADRRLASVFVVTRDGETIDAFYTLSAYAVLPQDLPPELAAKLPRLSVPVTLLGRMAVDQACRGRRLGEFVLLHALKRALRSSTEVSSWAVVVDSKEGARDFYLRYGFLPFSEQSDRLFLMMKDVEKLFE
jgi:predicted GNAT family N-acyltransferase